MSSGEERQLTMALAWHGPYHSNNQMHSFIHPLLHDTWQYDIVLATLYDILASELKSYVKIFSIGT